MVEKYYEKDIKTCIFDLTQEMTKDQLSNVKANYNEKDYPNTFFGAKQAQEDLQKELEIQNIFDSFQSDLSNLNNVLKNNMTIKDLRKNIADPTNARNYIDGGFILNDLRDQYDYKLSNEDYLKRCKDNARGTYNDLSVTKQVLDQNLQSLSEMENAQFYMDQYNAKHNSNYDLRTFFNYNKYDKDKSYLLLIKDDYNKSVDKDKQYTEKQIKDEQNKDDLINDMLKAIHKNLERKENWKSDPEFKEAYDEAEKELSNMEIRKIFIQYDDKDEAKNHLKINKLIKEYNKINDKAFNEEDFVKDFKKKRL